jgi:hypothetical protein
MWSDSGTKYFSAYPAVEWKPTSARELQDRAGLRVVCTRTPSTSPTESDPAATETFGNRYVFGTLDQTSVSAVMELNWTFTPKLSPRDLDPALHLVGRLHELRSLVRPRSYEFAPYAYGDNPGLHRVLTQG